MRTNGHTADRENPGSRDESVCSVSFERRAAYLVSTALAAPIAVRNSRTSDSETDCAWLPQLFRI